MTVRNLGRGILILGRVYQGSVWMLRVEAVHCRVPVGRGKARIWILLEGVNKDTGSETMEMRVW